MPKGMIFFFGMVLGALLVFIASEMDIRYPNEAMKRLVCGEAQKGER